MEFLANRPRQRRGVHFFRCVLVCCPAPPEVCWVRVPRTLGWPPHNITVGNFRGGIMNLFIAFACDLQPMGGLTPRTEGASRLMRPFSLCCASRSPSRGFSCHAFRDAEPAHGAELWAKLIGIGGRAMDPRGKCEYRRGGLRLGVAQQRRPILGSPIGGTPPAPKRGERMASVVMRKGIESRRLCSLRPTVFFRSHGAVRIHSYRDDVGLLRRGGQFAEGMSSAPR